MFIKSNYIVLEDKVIAGYLEVENKKIKAIHNQTLIINDYLDYSNNKIIAGIFDTHNHGTMGYSVMQGSNQTVLDGYLKGLASQGVTAILPTVGVEAFELVADMVGKDNDGAKVIGINSEGPYLNRVGEKGVDLGHPDIDLNHIKTMIANAKGHLKVMGMAPELPLAKEATQLLVEHDIRVAFTHSNCNYHEANEAFNYGMSVSTHTANVMSGIHHREMGGLGACLLNDDVYCEVICDSLHVSLEMLELMFKVKDYSKFMMISDCTPLSGAPVGRYVMKGFAEVNITKEGYCLSDTGRLCGSTKPVLYGIYNLVEKMQIPITTVSKMASLNPANVYGIAKNKGSIAVGKDADFIILDDNYNVVVTYSEGRKVYDSSIDNNLFNQELTSLKQ